jgi:hypothetical protein
MALVTALNQLNAELDGFSTHVRDFTSKKSALNSPIHFSFLEECFLEGLLSRIWQSWGLFCRACVIESCLGGITATGVTITGLAGAMSEADVSGAAIKAKQKPRTQYWGSPNTVLRLEPTWGDVDVLCAILGRLMPVNSPQLLAGFSSGHGSSSALQKIRNAAAHTNFQTISAIHAISSAYIAHPIVHPTHALFWIEPLSGDFLVTKSIEDLKSAGLAAIM